MSTPKIAAYVRVSTHMQNESGQVAALRIWLTANGYDPDSEQVEWYVDKASGKTFSRPEFERMQADVFAGHCTTIVVWKLDRLSRQLRDGLNVLCDWIDRGVRIVSVTQQIDLTGAVGRMVAAMLLAVAEMENEMRRERQAVGIEAAKKRGAYERSKRNRSGVTKAPKHRAIALRERGLTRPEIAAALKVSVRTVDNYLTDYGATPPVTPEAADCDQ